MEAKLMIISMIVYTRKSDGTKLQIELKGEVENKTEVLNMAWEIERAINSDTAKLRCDVSIKSE